MTNIYLASDHAGFNLKQNLISSSELTIYNLIDLGCHNVESVDYPDYAVKMAKAIKCDINAQGILICGTGIGISIAANRYPFIRAALCHNVEVAILAREHNNANILVLGAKYISLENAKKCINAFIETPFTKGRHQPRVDKLNNLLI